jgi:hypothetical protein
VPTALADLVAPVEVSRFLSEVHGRGHRRFKGTPGRFEHLLPWSRLNAVLAEHRLEPPRLRLAMDGATIPAELYTERVRNRRGVVIPRLQAGPLHEQLRRGATLVLDAVDELSAPVGELAAALERDLGEHVQVNAYASWGVIHGFDVHWDDHDVLVLQISGRKRWGVYGPSRPWPLHRDVEPAGPAPAEPIAEYLLGDGDVLYLPRGWWHVASAVDEPSLHLTFGYNPATGIDLVGWVADRLRADERFRAPLPRFGTVAERRALAAELGEALAAAWTLELVDEFLADRDAAASGRQRFSLPWAATPALLPPGDDAKVRLLAPRARLEAVDGTVALHAAGERWTFARPAEPLLAALADGGARSVAELCALPALDEQAVRALLGSW